MRNAMQPAFSSRADLRLSLLVMKIIRTDACGATISLFDARIVA